MLSDSTFETSSLATFSLSSDTKAAVVDDGVVVTAPIRPRELIFILGPGRNGLADPLILGRTDRTVVEDDSGACKNIMIVT